MPMLREHSVDLEADGERSPDWRRRRSREKRLRRIEHAGMASVCRSKIRYDTWHDAWKVCVRIGRRHSRVCTEPYRCVCCGGIHTRTNSGAESLRLTPR